MFNCPHDDILCIVSVFTAECPSAITKEHVMANIYANTASSQLSILNCVGYDICTMCILFWDYTSTNSLHGPFWLDSLVSVGCLHYDAYHLLLFRYMGGIRGRLGSVHPFHRFGWKYSDSVGVD
jgi:hypothetical protein